MALFGEKYGNIVRAIEYGDSIELCGGTHARATGCIGYFKITSESAVAAGIRRIEASTGTQAESVLYNIEDTLDALRRSLNNSPNVIGSLTKLLEDNEAFKQSIEQFKKERAITLKESILQNSRFVNGVNLLSIHAEADAEVIKNIAFMLKNEVTNAVFIGATYFKGKPTLTLMYTDDLVAQGANAGKEIRAAAKLIQGGGGGQAALATAGGKDVEGLSNAYNFLVESITNNN